MLALVTVVAARMYALCLDMLAVKHDDMGFLVVSRQWRGRWTWQAFLNSDRLFFKSRLAGQATQSQRCGLQAFVMDTFAALLLDTREQLLAHFG